MSFLPKGYEAPKTGGNYMKFQKGTNKLRILSDAVVGWEYWIDADGARKPIRVHDFDELPQEQRAQSKHFWAFVVHNYNEDKVQILELTQKSIMTAIDTYVNDEDWGDPKEYDLVVTRTGDGLETEYQTISKPKNVLKVIAPEINLEALFTGEDPFTTKEIKGSAKPIVEVVEDQREALAGKGAGSRVQDIYFAVAEDLGMSEGAAKNYALKQTGKKVFGAISNLELSKIIGEMKGDRTETKKNPETIDLDNVLQQEGIK
jgi:hypothetical protein